MWNDVVKMLVKLTEKNTFCAQLSALSKGPWISRLVCKQLTMRLPTAFAQALSIKTLLDFCYGCPYVGIEVYLFFNFFNGMDGGSVVFASQLTGDLREA
jgi:hypothetical protein